MRRVIEIDPWAALCHAAETSWGEGSEEEEPPEVDPHGQELVEALCAGGDDLAGRSAKAIKGPEYGEDQTHGFSRM